MWYGSSGVVYAELPRDGSTDVVERYVFSRSDVIWSLAEFVSMCCSLWLSGSTAMCWAELPVKRKYRVCVGGSSVSLCNG